MPCAIRQYLFLSAVSPCFALSHFVVSSIYRFYLTVLRFHSVDRRNQIRVHSCVSNSSVWVSRSCLYCFNCFLLNSLLTWPWSSLSSYAEASWLITKINYSTCFGRPSRPSSGVHKTLVAASGTDHTIWEASFPDSMICTGGCNYSFMHSWRWRRWTPETCRVI